MQLGSIPVYVYDEKWTPFSDEINWEDFCVMIPRDKIAKISNILYSITGDKIKEMSKNGEEIYEKYFTMDGMCKNIIKRI
jgi:hypothetical protein